MTRRPESRPFGWTDAIRAQLALIRAAWDVRRRETGRLLSLHGGPPGSDGRPSHPEAPPETSGGERATPGEPPEELARARRIGASVRSVARRGLVRPRCLAQALAVKRLLDRRGLGGARIRVGVKQDAPGIRAHAWVEYRGHVVGDFTEKVREYSDLPGLRVHATPDRGEAAEDS